MNKSTNRIDTILERHSRMPDQRYVDYVIRRISGEDVSDLWTIGKYHSYREEVPENLLECFKLHLEVNFDLKENLIYLIVLIYSTVSYAKTPDYNILGAFEFFMSELKDTHEQVPQNMFNNVFVVIFDLIAEYYKPPLELDTLIRFNEFLRSTKYSWTEHIQCIITILRKAIRETKEIINIENVLQTNWRKVDAAFMTLKYIFEIYEEDVNQFSELFTITLIGFCTDFSTSAEEENFIIIFKQIFKPCLTRKWFKHKFLKTMFVLENSELTVKLLKLCEKDDYNGIVRALINHFVTTPTDCDRLPFLQNTMFLIVNDPYRTDDYDDPNRQKIVDRIVREVIIKLGKSNESRKKAAMKIFFEWFESKDINLRRTLQKLCTDNNEQNSISILKLIKVLEAPLDIYWEDGSYNILFIKLMLSIFNSKPQYMYNRFLRIIEMLCYKATSAHLEVLIPHFTKVILKYGDKDAPILKPLLAILVHFGLEQTDTGKKFLLEIRKLIQNVFVKEEDAEIEFGILNVLISPDISSRDFFSTLESYLPISHDELMVLFEERTLKYGSVAWPFLSMLLDRHELDTFPTHFHQLLNDIKDTQFYMRSDAIYIIQIIHKVFKSKMNDNISADDKALAAKVLNILTNQLMSCTIPTKLANDVAVLLSTLSSIIGYECPKLKSWLLDTLNEIMYNLDHENVPINARKIAYLAHLIIPFKMEFNSNEENTLKEIIKLPNDLHHIVLAKLILLYARICAQNDSLEPSSVEFLVQFLKNDNLPEVEVVALASIYDLTKLRSLNYELLDVALLRLIKSENRSIQDASLKIFMELVNSDQLRLDATNSVEFLLAVLTRSLSIDLFLKDSFERDYISKSVRTIKNYFIHFLFYLNDYEPVSQYAVNKPLLVPVAYEKRCLLYRQLFCNIERHTQLYLLSVLSKDFLLGVCKGRITLFSAKSFSALRDVITLVSYYATENIEKVEDNRVFYLEFIKKLKRLLVTSCTTVETNFNKNLSVLIKGLLRITVRLDRTDASMVPQIYNAIALLTTAYYKNMIAIVTQNEKIRNLYFVYESLYSKYRSSILDKPLSNKVVTDKAEYVHYIDIDSDVMKW